MPLLVKLSGLNARIVGSEREDFVYVMIEALEASGFVVDFCAMRAPNSRGTGGTVLVTGATNGSIRRLAAELERLAGVAPTISDGTESTLMELSSTDRVIRAP